MFNVTEKDQIAVVEINIENQPMNVWSLEAASSFSDTMNDLLQKSLKGIVLTSKRPEFMAGADIKEFVREGAQGNVTKLGELLLSTFRNMEKSSIPIVAAINGTALGGGYELCLATKYRVMLNHPKARVGLPEVSLGLIPGGGGTQRLPRLIGIMPALQLMTEGKSLAPAKALEMGLVDELADSPEELMKKAIQWITDNPEVEQRWDVPKFRIPGGGVQTPKGYMTFSAGNGMIAEKTKNNYLAPRAVMSAVYEGIDLPIERGCEIESKYFVHCLNSPQSKALIRTMFFGLNAINKGRARPKGQDRSEVNKVGVLGAGMMGGGIAFACSKVGIEVVLKDISQEAADKGKAYSEKVLQKLIKRGRSTEDKAKKQLAMILATAKVEDLDGCDLIIEAVTEDRTIKQKVIEESEPKLTKSGFMSSNTSTLPITGLAEYSKMPEKFIGLHFFSPVDRMPLVEIIRGRQTNDETVARAFDFVRKLGKTPIVVNDGRAFYTSRVFSVYVNEGFACLQDGIEPALIENAGQMAGMPVGPLAVADEVSIDLMYHIIKQKEQDTGESDHSAASKVSKLFVEDLKRLGRKSGGGAYEYPEGRAKHLWPGLKEHFKTLDSQPDVEVVKKRLLYAQALEAAKVIEENVLEDPLDGDIGSIMGWGFAPHTGGIFSFMDQVGLSTMVEECDSFKEKYGEQFEVPEILRTMAKEGKTFFKADEFFV